MSYKIYDNKTNEAIMKEFQQLLSIKNEPY